MEYETYVLAKESQESKDQDEEETRKQGVDPLTTKIPSKSVQKSHLESQIIGNVESGIQTRRKHIPRAKVALISMIEPNNLSQEIIEES